MTHQHCWHCAPLIESYRYDHRGMCARCATDTEERPVRYTPKMVRGIYARLLAWEEAGTPKISGEDVKMAQAGLERIGRLSNLEQVVLRDRLYFGYSEQRVAISVGRDIATVRRNARVACRKVAAWLNSTPLLQAQRAPEAPPIEGYKRLLGKILGRGA